MKKIILLLLLLPCFAIAQVKPIKPKPSKGESGAQKNTPKRKTEPKKEVGTTPTTTVVTPTDDEKPNRISLRIGAGVNYYYNNISGLTPLNPNVSTGGFADIPEPMAIGTASLLLRFNIKPHKNKPLQRRDRSDSFGAFACYGFLGKKTIGQVYETHVAASLPASFGTLQNYHGFWEIEGGGLVREAFRISAGGGTQYVQGNEGTKGLQYYTGSLGAIIRFGIAEIDITGTGLFGGFYKSPSARINLTLNLHMRTMK